MPISIEWRIFVVRHRIIGPVQGPLFTMLLIGVVLEVNLIVFLTAAAGEINHVGIAGVFRKEHRLLTQTIVIEILVKPTVAQMIRVENISSKGSHTLDDLFQPDGEV